MSAAVGVMDALATALRGDGPLRSYLAASPAPVMPPTASADEIEAAAADATRVFKGHATTRLEQPDGTPWPYLVVRGFGEDDVGAYGAGTAAATLFDTTGKVHVWVPGRDERLALLGYRHVRRVLTGAPLVVDIDGRRAVRLDVRLTATVPQEDGQATQAVASVTTLSTA